MKSSFQTDEDDETTLSTDGVTCIETTRAPEEKPTATKVLEEIIKKEVAPKAFEKPKISASNLRSSSSQINATAPIRSEPNDFDRNYVTELRKSSSIHRLRRSVELTRFMSADQRSISDTEDSSTQVPNQALKTKSCANLELAHTNINQLTALRSPGAIIVREKFIDFPKKLIRNVENNSCVSIAGRTESRENVVSTNTLDTNGRILARKNTLPNPRFTTTRVDESELN